MGQLKYNLALTRRPNGKIDLTAKHETEINKLYKKLGWSKKAVGLSVKMLQEMSLTFPLHIGFMMYYEELNNQPKQRRMPWYHL